MRHFSETISACGSAGSTATFRRVRGRRTTQTGQGGSCRAGRVTAERLDGGRRPSETWWGDGGNYWEVVMKVQATLVLIFQAKSLEQSGAVLDDVLARARERDDVDVGRVEVVSPPGNRAVTLPPLPAGTWYAPRVPPPRQGSAPVMTTRVCGRSGRQAFGRGARSLSRDVSGRLGR